MKFKVDRIISIATLVASLAAIILVLKKPAPVTQPAPAAAQTVSQKPAQSEPGMQPPTYQQTTPQASESQPTEPASSTSNKPSALSSADLSAAVAKSLGGGTSGLTLDSDVGGGGEPNIKDQQVTYDGDIVHGKFLTTIAGKDVWVTISGKMGEKDGYATFDPTEFKVGDMNVPVSLVNPALQKKLADERDRLKIPDNTSH